MRTRLKVLFGLVAIIVLALTGVAAAFGGGSHNFDTRLDGYHEQPLAISTTGNGFFFARVDRAGDAIDYSLSFGSLSSTVTQAHIHFGQRNQAAGIAVFLCSNLGNGPAGTQACPTGPGRVTITGTIHAADVLALGAQGLAAGDFPAFLAAMRAGSTYVNVHSMTFPGGEIRGHLNH